MYLCNVASGVYEPSEYITVLGNVMYGSSSGYGILIAGTYTNQGLNYCSIIGNSISGTTLGEFSYGLHSFGIGNQIIDKSLNSLLSYNGANILEGPDKLGTGVSWLNASGTTPPTPWTVYATGTLYDIVDSGDGAPYDACLRMTNGVGGSGSMRLAIRSVVNKYYTLYFDVKKGTASGLQVNLGSTAGGTQYYTHNHTDASWTSYSITFKSTVDTIYIQLANNGGVGGAYSYIHLVYIKELPLSVSTKPPVLEDIPVYANNAAAIAGGLVAGQIYRVNAATDPEPLYIVH